MRLFLVAAALFASAQTIDARCAMVRLQADVLTRRHTHIPADGGVLVGSAPGHDQASGDRDPSDTTFETKTKLERTSLAPGLSVYKFTGANLSLGTSGTFTHDGKTAAITVAPSPKALAVTTAPSFRSTSTTGTLSLTAAPPEAAVAVIAYDDKGTALLYASLPDTHDQLKDVPLFSSGGHCGVPHPAAWTALASGGTYQFAYVDAFGRLGPKSKPQKL